MSLAFCICVGKKETKQRSLGGADLVMSEMMDAHTLSFETVSGKRAGGGDQIEFQGREIGREVIRQWRSRTSKY